MSQKNINSKDCGIQTSIMGHSEQFMFPRNPVITTEFGLNVLELVDIVFRVRSGGGGGDLSHSVRVRLLI